MAVSALDWMQRSLWGMAQGGSRAALVPGTATCGISPCHTSGMFPGPWRHPETPGRASKTPLHSSSNQKDGRMNIKLRGGKKPLSFKSCMSSSRFVRGYKVFDRVYLQGRRYKPSIQKYVGILDKIGLYILYIAACWCIRNEVCLTCLLVIKTQYRVLQCIFRLTLQE